MSTRAVLSFLTLCFLAFDPSHAEEVPLRLSENPAPPIAGFSEGANRSTPFYLWQNTPELIRASGSTREVTPFCIPATLTQLLARARVLAPASAGRIPLEGLSPDGQRLEGSAAILGFMNSCGIRLDSPIDPLQATQCVQHFLASGGLRDERVHLIRRLGDRPAVTGVRYENRSPTLEDLVDAVRSGDEVALTLAFMVWDSSLQRWRKDGSHMVNVTGFARNPGEERLILHISNPTRRYAMDGVRPVFDTLEVTPQDPALPAPEPYAPLRVRTLQGRLMEFEGKTTFVGGLIRVRITP